MALGKSNEEFEKYQILCRETEKEQNMKELEEDVKKLTMLKK